MDMEQTSVTTFPWSPSFKNGFGFEVLRLQDFYQRDFPTDHHPWQAHRISFHALILFTQGHGTHSVDWTNYPVQAGTQIHICANQVHHFGPHQDLDGLVVLFLPAALPTQLLGTSINVSRINVSSSLSWSTIQYIWPSVTSIEPGQANLLGQHIKLLEAYQHTGQSDSCQPAVQYLLWSLIASALQSAVSSTDHYQANYIDRRFLQFVELLEQSFESCRNTKWYADQIGCTARTLYRICITAVGKSPKAITDYRVAVEAQRRLLFTHNTVKDVGYSLGFEETTNFVKFFRRLVGKNPDEFRRLSKL